MAPPCWNEIGSAKVYLLVTQPVETKLAERKKLISPLPRGGRRICRSAFLSRRPFGYYLPITSYVTIFATKWSSNSGHGDRSYRNPLRPPDIKLHKLQTIPRIWLGRRRRINSQKQRRTAVERHRDDPATDKEHYNKDKTTADTCTELQRTKRQIRRIWTLSPQPPQPVSQ